MSLVSLRDITRKFPNVTAVDRLTIDIHEGEIFGLVGPDGAGKTTAIRIMLGILTPSSGSGSVGNLDLVRQSERISTLTGYVSQRFSLYGDLTVAENLNLFADLYRVPASERDSRFQRLMQFSRLDPFRDRLARNLSGGMKQKLALSCALVHTPKVLFLDEPTTGVDPLSRRDLWRLLFDLWQQGLTIIVSTPYMDEAERCSRIGFMNRGRLIAVDTPDTLRDNFRGRIIEVVPADKFGAKRLLETIPGVMDVNVFGEGLHVTVAPDAGELSAEALADHLRRMTVEVHSIQQVPPSMEDVFFQVTAEAESHAVVR